MKILEVDIVGETVNAVVVKLPGRRFPGILIQGDSLANLATFAESVVQALAETRLDDALDEAREALDLLTGYKRAYEEAMRSEGLELPYGQTEFPRV